MTNTDRLTVTVEIDLPELARKSGRTFGEYTDEILAVTRSREFTTALLVALSTDGTGSVGALQPWGRTATGRPKRGHLAAEVRVTSTSIDAGRRVLAQLVAERETDLGPASA